MSMKLDEVVPFGRSFDEYKHMFALSESDLEKKIIGVADGPACVNAEFHALGKEYISVDPLYTYSAEEINKRFDSVVDNVIEQVEASPNSWVWGYHKNAQNLKNNRVKVMQKFAADFEKGMQDGRYLIGELPKLDVSDQQFDIALCSHFLFLYSEFFSYEFHLEAILEMLRIAKEIRIFPLLSLDVKKSDYVSPLLEELENMGYAVAVKKVNYEFQKGGNEMLTVANS